MYVKNGNQKLWRHKATRYDPNYGLNPYYDTNTVDNSIVQDIVQQRANAEELYANHPLLKATLNNIVSHATLTGYTFSCNTGNKELDDEIEKHYNRWSSRYVDASGKWNLNQICEITIRNYLLYGESFAILTEPKGGLDALNPYRIAVRGVSPTRVMNPDKKVSKNRKYVAGIEIDRYGSPMYLHIKNVNGDNSTKRVPFTDREGNRLVFQTFQPMFYDQTHGVVPITAIYKTLLDLSIFQQTEVKAAMNSSQINVVATMETPERTNALTHGALNIGGDTSDKPPVYKPIMPVSAGDAIELLSGESLHQFKLERPNNMYAPFIKSNLEIICKCFEVDYKYIFADWADSNYASGRLAALQTQSQLAKLHKLVIDTFLHPLTTSFIMSLDADDKINIGNLEIEDVIESIVIRPPKMPLVDPQKETKNAIDLLKAGLSTKQREIEKLIGEDYRAVFAQQAREKQEIEQLGLAEDESDEIVNDVGRPATDGNTRS